MTDKIEKLKAAREKLGRIVKEATDSYMSEMRDLYAKTKLVTSALHLEGGLDSDDATERYVALRDKRSELKKNTDEIDAFLKEEMESIDAGLLEAMDAINAKSLKASGGTAYVQTKTRYNCSDWENYYSYIKEHDRFDLLEKRPAQGALGKFIEEGEELPPGISTYSERTVTVRRS